MYGTDHAVPSPRLAQIVADANTRRDDIAVRIETLSTYIRAFDAADADPAIPNPPAPTVWVGELRSAARANMLMNVTSARIDIKVAAGRTERVLERYAEPLAALHGAAWPERLLELAWRRVVDNSAHDSICGCSQDVVVSQVLTRFAEAEQIGRGVLAAAIRPLAERAPRGSVVVVNPSPRQRTDVVELDLDVPAAWPAVALALTDGRRVATQLVERPETVLRRLTMTGRQVPELFARRLHGRELFGHSLDGHTILRDSLPVDPAARPTDGALAGPADGMPARPAGGAPDPSATGRAPELILRVDDPSATPDFDVDSILDAVHEATAGDPDESWQVTVVRGDRRRLLAAVPAPALGASVVRAAEAVLVEAVDPGGTDAVRVGEREIANGHVRVTIADDGTLAIDGGGVHLAGVGRLVDGGDFGDTYNYGPPATDRIVESPAIVVTAATSPGPVRGVIEIVSRYDWPLGLAAGGAARSDVTAPVEITTSVEVRTGEPFVRFTIAFTNPARDHRVRWHLPLPEATDHSSAEGQFAVVDRGLTGEAGHGEVPTPTYPARGFVHVAGATVLLDHVTEYEVVDGRELALTVLRSTGLISRNDNPFREDPAGPEVAVPAAQMVGPWRFSFGLLPHAGSWDRPAVLEAVEAYQLPFVTAAGRGNDSGDRPQGIDDSGLTIDGNGVVLSALRRRGDELELRLVATTAAPTLATISGLAIAAARDVDLLGRAGLDRPVDPDGSLRLPLGAWEIRTIRLRTHASDSTPL
jgi:mannosylglycerate hydrolase